MIQTPAGTTNMPYQKGHKYEKQETSKYICNNLDVCMSLAGDDLGPNLNYKSHATYRK